MTALPVFSEDQRARAHRLLAARVAYMMGRKWEEGDWAYVYCTAKGIPIRGWSNLQIDVMYGGLGVEHKMLAFRSKPSIAEACGTTLMHPAATRSVRIDTALEATEAMKSVLGQYNDLIRQRTEAVKQDSHSSSADMRTGWLLWQETLCEFLYFEEAMHQPDWHDYYATWNVRKSGARKGSRNLWVYEKATGKKRYSITSDGGVKVQPYFDVPPLNDPNVYIFTVQGEEVEGVIRIWVTESTAEVLRRVLGTLAVDTVSSAIMSANPDVTGGGVSGGREPVVELRVTHEAYRRLNEAFEGVSDEHRMQLLAKLLVARGV